MSFGVGQGDPLPALVLTRVSGGSDYTYKGPAGLRRARVQIDSYGDSNASARSLQRALWAAMDGQVFTQGGIWFQSLLADARDLTEPGLTDAETVHRISSDFNLNFRE